MLMMAITNIFAQDFEPGQVPFNFGESGPSVYLSADLCYFKQRQFMLGWHWGASKKITQSLLVRQHDAADYSDISIMVDTCDVIVKPQCYTHAVGNEILNARAMQYEPTLELDPNKPEKLVIREGDTTRPVFGFLHRRGFIPTNPQDANFNRLIINTDSMGVLTNQVILDNPWPQNALTMFGKSKLSDSANYTFDNHLCRTLYISINLRRLDASAGNQPVLKIELPYTRHNASGGLIQFDSIPVSSASATAIYNNRGRYRKLMVAPAYRNYIVITKNMIPANSEDITISGFFRCNNDSTYHNFFLQPQLPFGGNLEANKIDSLGIRITYLGNAPIAIDWVRIETPHARRVFWSEIK